MKLNQISHIKLLLVLVLALERNEGFLLFLYRLFKLEREFFILVPDLCIFTFLPEHKPVLYSHLWSDRTCGVSLLHIWEPQPDLHSAAPQGGKGPAEINRGESNSRTLELKVFYNWRFFLISHVFNYEYKVHCQLLYVAFLTCLFLLSTHKGFFPNSLSFHIFGLCLSS